MLAVAGYKLSRFFYLYLLYDACLSPSQRGWAAY